MKSKVAIFDLDGTLYNGHTVVGILKVLESKGKFKSEQYNRIKELFEEYSKGVRPYEEMTHEVVTVIAVGLKGEKEKDIKSEIDNFIMDNKEKWYDFSFDLVNLFRGKGYKIIIISGSLRELQEPIEKLIGDLEFYGSNTEVREGVYTGEVERYGANAKAKEETVKEIFSRYGIKDSFGFGDTEADIGFLEKVENSIAVLPSKDLEKISRENGWKIVLKEENVLKEVEEIL